MIGFAKAVGEALSMIPLLLFGVAVILSPPYGVKSDFKELTGVDNPNDLFDQYELAELAGSAEKGKKRLLTSSPDIARFHKDINYAATLAVDCLYQNISLNPFHHTADITNLVVAIMGKHAILRPRLDPALPGGLPMEFPSRSEMRDVLLREGFSEKEIDTPGGILQWGTAVETRIGTRARPVQAVLLLAMHALTTELAIPLTSDPTQPEADVLVQREAMQEMFDRLNTRMPLMFPEMVARTERYEDWMLGLRLNYRVVTALREGKHRRTLFVGRLVPFAKSEMNAHGMPSWQARRPKGRS